MPVDRWVDLKHKIPPERQRRIRQRVKQEVAELEVLEMNLQELRKAAGKTQEELAEVLDLSQGELSQAERREDHLLSTLRRYVEALGGELEVVAHVGDKRVRLVGV
jgi:DNA-binding XRE family transcriptional regulator